jgi:biopolymer transport protein ExbD
MGILTGLLIAILALLFQGITYQQPEFCNPCSDMPDAVTGVPLPKEAVVVWVYSGRRGQFVSLYANLPRPEYIGRTEESVQISEFVSQASVSYPDLPFIVKGDAEAPYELVQAVLDALRANDVRQVFFQTDLRFDVE